MGDGDQWYYSSFLSLRSVKEMLVVELWSSHIYDVRFRMKYFFCNFIPKALIYPRWCHIFWLILHTKPCSNNIFTVGLSPTWKVLKCNNSMSQSVTPLHFSICKNYHRQLQCLNPLVQSHQTILLVLWKIFFIWHLILFQWNIRN